ncbi:MAG: class I SAM-dependent methyltransferase [Pedobacter sp.]|nr:class I SAM-dependent methyltransferase [Pedobacter sp.]
MIKLLKILFKRYINKFGFELKPTGQGYFCPYTVVPLAKEKNMSLCEYLETYNEGGVGKRRDYIVEKLFSILPKSISSILEIGTGTGMYLEKLYPHYTPKKYEVYETALSWVQYLKEEYKDLKQIQYHSADGKTLWQTKTESIDLVTSHGVFVYLPLISSVQYLDEMYRACTKSGYIVFDCFTDENFSLPTVNDWLKEEHEYRFPVLIPVKIINAYALKNNLELVSKFEVNYHASFSTYYILKKL